jgi:hypothetical protein
MRRSHFAVLEWYDETRRREFFAVTAEDEHKAAWLVGSAFANAHPRTPIRRLELLSQEVVKKAEPDDLRDLNEWREEPHRRGNAGALQSHRT